MKTEYLTKELIIAIHHELIERFGGFHGIRDEALLESAVGRCQSGYYADHVEEAAALMESLGRNHPFVDGNKRIAVAATFTFLTINGQEVIAEEEAAFEFISELFESHEFSFARLEPWIRRNTKLLNTDKYTNEAIADEKHTELEALMEALSKLFAVIQEANFFLKQRTNEVSLIESTGKSGNPILAVESAIKWMKITAADFNFYSDQIAQHGDDFLKSWATIAQWTEDQARYMQNIERLTNLSGMFGEMARAIDKMRNELSSGTKIIESTTSSFGELRQLVNAIPTPYKATGDQILTVLEGYENSIDRYTNAQQYFDEQLAITVDSCNRLMRLIVNRVDEHH
jgi:death on curing protein